MPSVLDASLAEISRQLDSGEVSSRMLTEASIQAALRSQAELNAFIEIRAEQALRQAENADRQRAQGRRLGPLHGVPLAHKDIFFRSGERTTAGSKTLADFRPTETSAVLERLDAAGAVDVGTLNLAEFCVGPTGQNDHSGACRNPWDVTRISGGSSSGSGAAVGARVVFGSIGSDTGGSIRLPAGLCGVVGLKPSHGRVSLRGAIERCWSLDVFGPLARTAEDAALLMDAIAGFDPDDPLSRAGPEPACFAGLSSPVSDLRVGVPMSLFDALEPDVAARHSEALDVLRGLGVTLEDVALPDTDRLYALTTVINNVEATFLHRRGIDLHPGDYNRSTLSRIDRGGNILALDYLDAVRGRATERRRFEAETLAGCAALYLPLLDFETPTLAEVTFADAEGADRIVPRLTRWTRWVSYLGLPAMALPIGFSRNGLPVACQLLGHFFTEEILLRLGAAYQKETAWHDARPLASERPRA